GPDHDAHPPSVCPRVAPVTPFPPDGAAPALSSHAVPPTVRTRRGCRAVRAGGSPRLVGVEEQDGLSRGRADAEARGIPIEIRERPAARSLEEAAEILGISPRDIAKSIVMRAGADTYLFAVVPGDASVSFAKVRALLGVNKLKFPSAEEAFEVTGHERGTITPLEIGRASCRERGGVWVLDAGWKNKKRLDYEDQHT